MATRVVTRIGDIFRVEMDNGSQRFFQYITRDSCQLGSPVIRVFKEVYPADYVLDAEDVVNGEVDFYAHTGLQIGIKQNCWQKVGKSKNLGETEHIMFRFHNFEPHGSRTWYVWPINGESRQIGPLTEEYRQCSNLGHIYSYESLTYRIRYGRDIGTCFTQDEL